MEKRIGKQKYPRFLNKIYIFDVYYNKFFIKNFIIFSFLFIMVYFFSLLLAALPELLKKSSYNDFITTRNILTYYYLLIPSYINNTISFAYLFSVSYSLGVFYQQKEILALVASGIKTIRISLWSLIFGVVLSILLFLANAFIFPIWLNQAETYKVKLNLNKDEQYINNIQIRDTNKILYFGQYFLESENTLQDYLIIKENDNCAEFKIQNNFIWRDIKGDNIHTIIETLFEPDADIPSCFPFDWYIRGDKLIYNTEKKMWVAHDFIRVEFDVKTQLVTSIEEKKEESLPQIDLEPSFFKQEKKDIEILTLREAYYHLEQMKIHLEPTREFIINLIDSKYLKPFHLIILGLFASTMGKFFSRKNIFISSLIFSFLIGFAFLILVHIGYSLAKTYTIPIWLGLSFGYFMGGLIFFYYLRKQMT